MKYFLSIFLISISLFGDSLEELVDFALQNNTLIKKQTLNRDIASLKREESKKAQYGDVALVGGVDHYNSPRTLSPLTPSVMMGGVPITTTKTIYSVGVSYSVPLFTGFAQTREIQMSEIAKKMANVKVKLTKEQLAYNVKSLYLSILAQMEMLNAQKSYTKALIELKNTISEYVKLGKRAKIDLLKAEANVESSLTSQETTKANIKTLKATLSSLVGKSVDELEEVIITVKKPSYDVKSLFAKSASLSRVNIYDMGIKKAQKAVQKSKSTKYPQINLNSYFGKNYGDDIGPNGWDNADMVQVGLKLKYTLFDFGKRDIAIQKAKLSEMEAKLDRAQVLLDVKKMIIEAVAKIEKNYYGYLSSTKEMKLSKKSEDIEKVRYENGVSTINDLLLAKSKSEFALAKTILAKYDYQKSIYYLDYVLERGVK
ncbi:MAG: TolC family protein [Epsilonproteobacteria bacterium]|nr:TolC family protein [Campylobacterota bacterium]